MSTSTAASTAAHAGAPPWIPPPSTGSNAPEPPCSAEAEDEVAPRDWSAAASWATSSRMAAASTTPAEAAASSGGGGGLEAWIITIVVNSNTTVSPILALCTVVRALVINSTVEAACARTAAYDHPHSELEHQLVLYMYYSFVEDERVCWGLKSGRDTGGIWELAILGHFGRDILGAVYPYWHSYGRFKDLFGIKNRNCVSKRLLIGLARNGTWVLPEVYASRSAGLSAFSMSARRRAAAAAARGRLWPSFEKNCTRRSVKSTEPRATATSMSMVHASAATLESEVVCATLIRAFSSCRKASVWRAGRSPQKAKGGCAARTLVSASSASLHSTGSDFRRWSIMKMEPWSKPNPTCITECSRRIACGGNLYKGALGVKSRSAGFERYHRLSSPQTLI
eukprot:1188086-Prorocentrum_minimum.AAC.1